MTENKTKLINCSEIDISFHVIILILFIIFPLSIILFFIKDDLCDNDIYCNAACISLSVGLFLFGLLLLLYIYKKWVQHIEKCIIKL